MSSQHQFGSGTPDCPVVHRTVSGAPGWPTVNRLLSGKRRGVRLKLTGLSGGAPDSVRCARLADGELAALGKTQRRTAKIHRTVRWCTRLSGELTVGCAIRGRHMARSNGRLGTPDCLVCIGQCPVRQPTPRTNSRMRQIWKEIAHRTATVTVR
jgi:hypothetical protein